MIVEKARKLRHVIELLTETLEDEDALEVSELFSNWKEDRTYNIGDRVRYNDILYKCLIMHKAQPDWNPEVSSSLWVKVLIPDPETILEWIQPESTNPYMIGDKVIHNGKTWICIVDNNVWEPGVYGWNEINE